MRNLVAILFSMNIGTKIHNHNIGSIEIQYTNKSKILLFKKRFKNKFKSMKKFSRLRNNDKKKLVNVSLNFDFIYFIFRRFKLNKHYT